jgi:predicted ATPase
VVDENNLPAQVASLRRVLGAGAISTVSGHGYRLELPVSLPNAAPAPAPPREEVRPLRTLLPERLAPLVGREADLAELWPTLARSGLTTIVGTAGAGKTRIARELTAGAKEALGVEAAWVSLQSINDVELVPSAIALAAGLALPKDAPGFGGLQRVFAQQPLLLVLDNAEHLGEQLAAPLAELVQRTQGLRLLVTSQVPLGIPGESVYRLAVLPVPFRAVTRDEARDYAAVELFVQRATAAERRFELTDANTSQVVEICRRLDGNPLALELAAARVPALGVGSLLERLDDRFQLLKAARAAPDARHGTLHAAFDWSYGLLSGAEQRAFDRLGSFSGSFTLQAAAQCVADESMDTIEAIDLIGRLVDRSLVAALPTEPPRYRLSETARHFAAERLRANGTLEDANRRMARTLLDVMDAAYQEYWSMDEALWLARYAPELDNLRAAMDWVGAADAELGVALYGSSWPLFVEADLHAEARRRFEHAVKLIGDGLLRDRVGRFWNAVATYDSMRQWDRARYAAELAAGMHAAAGNARARYYALCLHALNARGAQQEARAAFDTARRIEAPDWPPRLLAHGAMTEGTLLASDGQFAAGRDAFARAMRLALSTSERQALAATVNIVELDLASGDVAGALQLARPLALSLRHSGRRETRIELLALLFAALLLSGQTDDAFESGVEFYQLAREFDPSRLHLGLEAMALAACARGRHADAARIIACSDAAHAAHGQAQLRPVEQRLRAVAVAQLEERRGPAWCHIPGDARDRLDEATACALALGLEV